MSWWLQGHWVDLVPVAEQQYAHNHLKNPLLAWTITVLILIQQLIDHCSSRAILHFLDLSVLPRLDHLNTAWLSLRATRWCLSKLKIYSEASTFHGMRTWAHTEDLKILRRRTRGYPEIPALAAVRTSQHGRCESSNQLLFVEHHSLIAHVEVVTLAAR